LTRVRDSSEFEDANIRPEIQKCLKFGRPVLDQIFKVNFERLIESEEKSVAVLFCGPVEMGNEVAVLTERYSRDGIRFDFHNEVFEF